MAIPALQMAYVGAYVLRQHLARRKRYPLVLMLEPLFRCNLACAGCGKIDYPDEILNQRLSVADYSPRAQGGQIVHEMGETARTFSVRVCGDRRSRQRQRRLLACAGGVDRSRGEIGRLLETEPPRHANADSARSLASMQASTSFTNATMPASIMTSSAVFAQFRAPADCDIDAATLNIRSRREKEIAA